ncbi:MAG TPA: pyridoxamine 5'-phosphate oxidase family protein [Acidimicrobiia bacterium]|jgi:nitroimidazol reductase NimA-like FMN-containing flavoprotein (pyridoxamine 5'-phosphate oxidase superfamily)|nr:pyridoxamine 5'-phosphate oxidase family protein [Acidimicrobiia bacterium]
MTSRGLDIIDRAECDILLRGRTLGRVGVKIADELVILPVYYAVVDDDIVFRTDPGTKLDAAVQGARVAFEVDGTAPGWSVLVTGHAREIKEAEAQQHARTRLGNDWPEGERDHVIAIRMESVSGRRLPGPR